MKVDKLPLIKQLVEPKVNVPKIDALVEVLSVEEKETLALGTEDFALPGSFPVHDANPQDDDLVKDIQCEGSNAMFSFYIANLETISQYAYRHVVKYLRPPLSLGFRRIEWSCVSHMISLNGVHANVDLGLRRVSIWRFLG